MFLDVLHKQEVFHTPSHRWNHFHSPPKLKHSARTMLANEDTTIILAKGKKLNANIHTLQCWYAHVLFSVQQSHIMQTVFEQNLKCISGWLYLVKGPDLFHYNGIDISIQNLHKIFQEMLPKTYLLHQFQGLLDRVHMQPKPLIQQKNLLYISLYHADFLLSWCIFSGQFTLLILEHLYHHAFI
mgnify:CR=1 FL=1